MLRSQASPKENVTVQQDDYIRLPTQPHCLAFVKPSATNDAVNELVVVLLIFCRLLHLATDKWEEGQSCRTLGSTTKSS